MKNLIKQIEHNNGKFPREQLQQIIERKDEAIPELIEILEEVKKNPEKYIKDEKYFAHIYAVYLLSQFRVKEAFKSIIDIFSLADETPHDLFGDTICEAGGRILASLCNGDILEIKKLIKNSNIDEYVRGQGLKSLVILVLNNKLSREEVIEYFRSLLNGALKDKQPCVMAEIVCCCEDLYPEEVYDDIKKAYENDEIFEGIIGIDSIERTLKKNKEEVLMHTKHDTHLQMINDTIDELQYWACFDRGNKVKQNNCSMIKSSFYNDTTIIKDKKIGRNDPCTCGSGKKYKKCCGKNI